jgi:hypothetical protein
MPCPSSRGDREAIGEFRYPDTSGGKKGGVLGEDPVVTVVFAQFREADFLAGNSYRHAAVQIAARYEGQEDHLEGGDFKQEAKCKIERM